MNTAPQTSATTETVAAPAEELTEIQFDIIRTAFNLARNARASELPTLRKRLYDMYPGQDDDILAALNFWANHQAESNRRNGV